MDPMTISAMISGVSALGGIGGSMFGANSAANSQSSMMNMQSQIARQRMEQEQRQYEANMLMNIMNYNRQGQQLDRQDFVTERAYNDGTAAAKAAIVAAERNRTEALALNERDRRYSINERERDRNYSIGEYDRNRNYNEFQYERNRAQGLSDRERDRTYSMDQYERNRRYGTQQYERNRADAIGEREEQNAFAKKQYNDALDASRAGRIDSEGNEVYFDEATNTWKTKIDPAVKARRDTSNRVATEQLVQGAERFKHGQEENNDQRNIARNEADALLRRIQQRIGAPSLEGDQGRQTVAAVTRAGASGDSREALARALIRSGGGNKATDATFRNIDNATGNSIKVAIADAAAAAPDKYRDQEATWRSNLQNSRAPLAQEASGSPPPNATGQVGVNLDGYMGGTKPGMNAAFGGANAGVTYANNNTGLPGNNGLVQGGGVSGAPNSANGVPNFSRTGLPGGGVNVPGSTGYDALIRASMPGAVTITNGGSGVSGTTNGYSDLYKSYGNTPYQMPWGSGAIALGEVAKNMYEVFGKSKGNGIPWNEDSRNPDAFNKWTF